MNRTLAYAHAYGVATEGTFTLGMSLDGANPLEWYRFKLLRLRRHLLWVTRAFEGTGAKEKYPDLYDPLHDAEVSMREALLGHFIDRDGILCANAYLGIILDLPRGKGGRKDVA